MKRTLISLAVLASLAAGSSLAQTTAQTGPTLYGNLDLGVLSINNLTPSPLAYVPLAAKGASSVQMKDGGLGASNWGIRGREDLGGGYAALYQLQGNLNTKDGITGGVNSTGGTSFFNQTAMVGLAGPFGELRFGRQVSPMYWAMASTDARGGRYFGSVLTALVGLNSASGAWAGNQSNVAFGTIYNDNAILYTAPTFANITVNAEYALGNTAGSGRANVQEALTAVYDANGLKLSALWYNGYGNNLGVATALYTAATGSAATGAAAAAAAGFSPTANTNRLASVGALYTLGTWTVSGSLMQARNPAHAIVKGGSDSLDLWSVGAGWRPVPHINLTAGYYRVKDNRNAGNKSSQFAMGAEYSLSRRSLLYVQVGEVKNEGANMNMSPVYASPVVPNTSVHALMVGMRHSF